MVSKAIVGIGVGVGIIAIVIIIIIVLNSNKKTISTPNGNDNDNDNGNEGPPAIGPPIDLDKEVYYSPPTISGFTARPDIVLREVEKERVIALPFPSENVFPSGHNGPSRLSMFMGLPVHPY